MSAWLPTGVYAWAIGLAGQDWPVIAAPALVGMALWVMAAVLRWVEYATGGWRE